MQNQWHSKILFFSSQLKELFDTLTVCPWMKPIILETKDRLRHKKLQFECFEVSDTFDLNGFKPGGFFLADFNGKDIVGLPAQIPLGLLAPLAVHELTHLTDFEFYMDRLILEKLKLDSSVQGKKTFQRACKARIEAAEIRAYRNQWRWIDDVGVRDPSYSIFIEEYTSKGWRMKDFTILDQIGSSSR